MSLRTTLGKNTVILVVRGSMASARSGTRLHSEIAHCFINGFGQVSVDLSRAKRLGAHALYALMRAKVDADHVSGSLRLRHPEGAAENLMYAAKLLTMFDTVE